MDEATILRLKTLNHLFYQQFAEPFADSRVAPQPGWARLVEVVALRDDTTVLDVGCGDGRFGRYLRRERPRLTYVGVDFGSHLLARARAADAAGTYVERDLAEPGALNGLGAFGFIACLSTLQHVPGRDRRVRLLADVARHLDVGGRLALANWQFAQNERLVRKVVPWAEAGMDEGAVEPGDFLLSWNRGGRGFRYVSMIDETETRRLADDAGLRWITCFQSDGHEGDLNLYAVLSR